MKATKPFCLEHAKDGAPIASRDGKPLRFLMHVPTAPQHASFVVLADERIIRVLAADGSYMPGECSQLDAVMVPLGYIDGKPVFWGDDLVGPNGEQVRITESGINISRCRWPSPGKQYPVTRMTHDEMWDAIRKVVPVQFSIGVANLGEPYGPKDVTAAVANAALRHAIDNAQIVSNDDCTAAVDALMKLYKDATSDRAARDMAIAEAVKQAAYLAAAQAEAGFRTLAVDRIDLAAIIAKVTK